jgi:hypothetical protein
MIKLGIGKWAKTPAKPPADSQSRIHVFDSLSVAIGGWVSAEKLIETNLCFWF